MTPVTQKGVRHYVVSAVRNNNTILFSSAVTAIQRTVGDTEDSWVIQRRVGDTEDNWVIQRRMGDTKESG